MALTTHDSWKGNSALPVPNCHAERVQPHQYYVPNAKAKSKSRAASHAMEFLSRVFANDGASRFFKTFLLRYLFDGGSPSSDDCSGSMTLAPAI
jgi:hypothetical protein